MYSCACPGPLPPIAMASNTHFLKTKGNIPALRLLSNREHLQTELDAAEAALSETVARAGGTIAEDPDLQIENARACCRRIRAELIRLDRLVDKMIPPEK